MGGVSRMIARGNAVCIATLVMALALAAQGCGGGHGGAASLEVDHGAQVAGQAPGAGLASQPESSSSGGALVNRDEPIIGHRVSRSLEEKERLIREWFSLPEAQPDSDAAAQVNSRIADSLVVHYQRANDLESINALRGQIQQQGSMGVSDLPSGLSEDLSSVTPEPVGLSLADFIPSIEMTQPFSVLRQHDTNPVLSRHLASSYQLVLLEEVYFRTSNFAVFAVDPAVDEEELAVRILKENNDFIYMVDASMLIPYADHHPRYREGLLDYRGVVGHGIDPLTNGYTDTMSYWTHDEGWGVFQTNAHVIHSSYLVDPEASLFAVRPTGWMAKLFILDTGVEGDHPDLPWEGVDFPALVMAMDPDPDPQPGYWDPYGSEPLFEASNFHGIMVAGAAVARSEAGGVTGTLPGGQVIPFRVGDRCQLDFLCEEALCRIFAIKDDPIYAAQAMSTSFATTGLGPEAGPALDNMLTMVETDPYFVWITAAGNNGLPVFEPQTQRGIWPAAFARQSPNVISVGGVDIDDERWVDPEEYLFSNYPAVDPGADYCSVTICGPSSTRHIMALDMNQGYRPSGCTSYATPAVAGIVAQLQAYAPFLTAEMIKSHLFITGRSTYWDRETALPQFGPYPYSLPIADASLALPWVDVRSPEYDPSFPDVRQTISGPTDITVWANLPGGWLMNYRDGYELRVSVTDSLGHEWPIHVISDIAEDDGQYPNVNVTFEFDPGEYPWIANGIIEIAAHLHHPAFPTVASRPVEANLFHGPGIGWYEQVIADDAIPRNDALAVGTDAVGKLHVSWFDYAPAAERTLYLSREEYPGSTTFGDPVVVEQSPPAANWSYANLSITSHQGQTGMLYSRRYGGGSAQENACWAVPFPDGAFTFEDCPASAGFFPGSLCAGGPGDHKWILHGHPLLGFDLAEQISFDNWTDAALGGLPPEASSGSGTLFSQGTELRGAFSMTVNGFARVYHGVINTSPPGLATTQMPLYPGTSYETWLDTALSSGIGQYDPKFSPWLFTRSEDAANPNGHTYMLATIPGATGFEKQLIEECTDEGYNSPMSHAACAAAVYVPVRNDVAVAYLSGVATAGGTLAVKIAYYTPTGWDIYVVGEHAQPESIAATIRDNQIILVYSQVVDSQWRLTAAFEPSSLQ